MAARGGGFGIGAEALYSQKGARDEVPIASLTKVFTAVQALEMASPDTLM